MSDSRHPTNPNWVMFDPEEVPPPENCELLVLSEGGVLLKMPWYDGAKAWCYKPVVPKSVKERMCLNLSQVGN